MIIFSGGFYLSEDIIYNKNELNVFLPAGKAAIAGIIVNLENDRLTQPEIVCIYNNIQTRIPVRYVYIDEKIVDFESGLDVIIDIIPAVEGNRINPLGAAIYLSQKVSKSLFARLFLMDDVFNEYAMVKLIHSEDDPIVKSLKGQGAIKGDFVYYQGFRGPIKIWETYYPKDTKTVPEFYERINFEEAGFGSLDKLFE